MQGFKDGLKETEDIQKMAQVGKNAILVLIAMFSMPVLVFFRHHFGERGINQAASLVALLLMSTAAVLSQSIVGGLVLVAYFFMLLGRISAIKKRARKGEQWYSYSEGISEIPTGRGLSPLTAQVVVEPLLVTVAGVVLLVVSRGVFGSIDLFGAYLILAGIAHMLRENMIQQAARNQLLDKIDQKLLSEHWSKALEKDVDPRETSGVAVPGSDNWTDQDRETMRSAWQDNLGLPVDLDRAHGQEHEPDAPLPPKVIVKQTQPATQITSKP